MRGLNDVVTATTDDDALLRADDAFVLSDDVLKLVDGVNTN